MSPDVWYQKLYGVLRLMSEFLIDGSASLLYSSRSHVVGRHTVLFLTSLNWWFFESSREKVSGPLEQMPSLIVTWFDQFTCTLGGHIIIGVTYHAISRCLCYSSYVIILDSRVTWRWCCAQFTLLLYKFIYGECSGSLDRHWITWSRISHMWACWSLDWVHLTTWSVTWSH